MSNLEMRTRNRSRTGVDLMRPRRQLTAMPARLSYASFVSIRRVAIVTRINAATLQCARDSSLERVHDVRVGVSLRVS